MENIKLDIEFGAYYSEKSKTFDGGIYPFLEYLKSNKVTDATIRLDTDNYPYEETDIYCEKMTIKKLSYEVLDDKRTYTAHVETDPASAKVLIKTLLNIGYLGNGGHTYSFRVGKEKFYFDGDGADWVKSINGKKVFRPKDFVKDASEIYKKGQQPSEDMFNEIVSECMKKIIDKTSILK
jgi:hypothetical protein